MDAAEDMPVYREGVWENDIGWMCVRLYEEVGTELSKTGEASAKTGPQRALKVSGGGVSGDRAASERRKCGDLLGGRKRTEHGGELREGLCAQRTSAGRAGGDEERACEHALCHQRERLAAVYAV